HKLALGFSVVVLAAACSSSGTSDSTSSAPDSGGSAPSSDGAPSPTAEGGTDSQPAVDSGHATDASPATTCTATGGHLAVGPCQGTAMQQNNVVHGCAPTVDGTLHLDEWQDAACFMAGGQDMAVYMKYAGDSVYMATIGNPTCGCGMPFYF